MKEFIVCLFILWTFIQIRDATYQDCGSTLGTVQSVEISDCKPDDARCTLHRNTNCSIKIKFTPKENVNAITAVVHGVIMTVPVNFPLPNSNGCVDSGLSCPLAAGKSYLYETQLPVLKSYPKLTVDVKWELKVVPKNVPPNKTQEDTTVPEDTSDDLVCILIPARIQ